MTIFITTGKGYGRTSLSAFDSALKDAGVYNYNLITLSSIIPPRTVIKVEKYLAPPEDYGSRLYLVKAEIRSRESGKYIGAALGWYQLPDGRGVFVEHEEIGETKSAVESNLAEDIRKSLVDLCRARKFPIIEKNIKVKTSVVKIEDSAASALVVGVYKSEGWGEVK